MDFTLNTNSSVDHNAVILVAVATLVVATAIILISKLAK